MRLVPKLDREAELFAALTATAASLIAVGEAAKMLDVSTALVNNLIREGKIMSARIGFFRVMYRADIDELVRVRAARKKRLAE